MNWYLKCLKQYADFSGRARRKEYWMFVLFNTIFAIVATIIDKIVGTERVFYRLYGLAVFIPGLAVTVRRLHDVGKSGWMYFIGLIIPVGTIWVFILLMRDSQQGNNKWGENPKEIAS